MRADPIQLEETGDVPIRRVVVEPGIRVHQEGYALFVGYGRPTFDLPELAVVAIVAFLLGVLVPS